MTCAEYARIYLHTSLVVSRGKKGDASKEKENNRDLFRDRKKNVTITSVFIILNKSHVNSFFYVF
jgi:hypothetical protein